MEPYEQAQQIINKHYRALETEGYEQSDILKLAVKHSIVTVIFIKASNPHANPFNSDGKSTYAYWEQVYNEIIKHKQSGNQRKNRTVKN